ncbi:MAG TPA: DUF5995 family protein [Anaerolineales bacterium]|nr:DUF5995 family protein [Anaerolineales bacterium]
MIPTEEPVVARMGALIRDWEATGNPQAVFLRCYRMMTSNTHVAITRGEFVDPRWVNGFLNRFADYYFKALEVYEVDPPSAPLVWQLAHDTTRDPGTLPVQNLLLGVNAHINFDLVLTLEELLCPEWGSLSREQRGERYHDYTYINDIIARTIDGVQDEILDPVMPVMDILDRLMGRVDELLVSMLIRKWRESVWKHARSLLEAGTDDERKALVDLVEEDALKIGGMIRGLLEPGP